MSGADQKVMGLSQTLDGERSCILRRSVTNRINNTLHNALMLSVVWLHALAAVARHGPTAYINIAE